MKSFIFSLLLALTLTPLVAADVPLNTLTDAEKAAGWKLLFDGKDASASWREYKKDKLPEGWVAEDGALVRKAAIKTCATIRIATFLRSKAIHVLLMVSRSQFG